MLRIRPATARDLPFIQAWVPRSALEALCPEDRARANPARLRENASKVLHMLTAGQIPSLILLAEANGVPVGYLLGTVGQDGTTGDIQGNILDLFVVPHMRGRKAGTMLQQAALRQFAAMGIRKAKLVIDVSNIVGLRLAESTGFKPEGLIGLKEW